MSKETCMYVKRPTKDTDMYENYSRTKEFQYLHVDFDIFVVPQIHIFMNPRYGKCVKREVHVSKKACKRDSAKARVAIYFFQCI